MAQFSYIAIAGNGEKIAGDIEAHSRDAVFEQLQRLGHYAVDIREGSLSKSHRRTGAPGLGLFGRPLSASAITMFTRELGMLLSAGVTLDNAFALILQDASAPKLGKLVAELRALVNDGKSFHEALAARGDLFPAAYVSVVRIAEASGTLDKAMKRIADDRERDQKLRAKMLSATMYPAFLILTAIAAVGVMMGVVVPRFKTMILNTGVELPEATRLLIGASDWLGANVMFLCGGLAAVVIALYLLARSSAFWRALDPILLRMPLIGHLIRLRLNIVFCRNMGSLLENGVDLPDALKLTRGVIGNQKAADVVGEAHAALRKGQEFTLPLAKSGLFLPVAINMLKIGEETGGLAQSTLYLAKMFEDKLEIAVQRTFTVLEPLIVILVSLFVAAVIVLIIGAVISVNDLAL